VSAPLVPYTNTPHPLLSFPFFFSLPHRWRHDFLFLPLEEKPRFFFFFFRKAKCHDRCFLPKKAAFSTNKLPPFEAISSPPPEEIAARTGEPLPPRLRPSPDPPQPRLSPFFFFFCLFFRTAGSLFFFFSQRGQTKQQNSRFFPFFHHPL